MRLADHLIDFKYFDGVSKRLYDAIQDAGSEMEAKKLAATLFDKIMGGELK